MDSILIEKMKFEKQPIAVYFTDKKPENARQFEEGKRNCAVSALLAASGGQIFAIDEQTCGCAGGGVGLCFGDTFSKRGHPTDRLLSTGFSDTPEQSGEMPRHLLQGERFFASPELANKWKSSFPYQDLPTKYVVFKPFELVDSNEPPDLVFILANPDQLSALVVMAGFTRGTMFNVVAPFAAACQSIAIAHEESKKETPNAVMGLFDISQRNRVQKDLLSLTMPYSMFCDMEENVEQSCLITESWERIDGRWLKDQADI